MRKANGSAGKKTGQSGLPREGVVHMWRADLAVAAGALEHLLDESELARAARIVDERDRIRWARSRGVLRALLGRYLDRDPRELRFVLGPHGKPALCDTTGPDTDLRFSRRTPARSRCMR